MKMLTIGISNALTGSGRWRFCGLVMENGIYSNSSIN